MTGTVRPRVAGMVLVALGLTLTSACGGSSEGAADPGPACMQSLSPASVPSDGTFPTDWPFPPGTVVTATEEAPGGGLAVTAQVGSDFEKVLVARTPLGRVGQPRDIADAAVFLASDDARWLTGERLLATGGLR